MNNKNHNLNNSVREKANRVLIVDDDEDFAEGLVVILVSRGYTVKLAHDPASAQKIIKNFDPGVALIDIRLEHSSGIYLIGTLKAERKNLLCVMMTASTETENAINALKNGAYDYLLKPFKAEELLYTLDRCFEKINAGQKKTEMEEELKKSHERLLTIMDSLNSALYVSDMKTYKILFANKFLKNMVGDIVGKLCWKVLEANQTGPCAFCENKKLHTAKGEPLDLDVEEHQDPITGKWYEKYCKAIRWSDGQWARLCISNDITQKKETEKRILRRLFLDEALAQASKLFTAPKGPDINKVLQILGDAVTVNRGFIYCLREKSRIMDLKYEWHKLKIKPEYEIPQNLDMTLYPWWTKKLENDETIVIPDVAHMHEVPSAEKEMLQALSKNSVIVVPIKSEKDVLWGFIGFSSTEKCMKWSYEKNRALHIISEMLSNYFTRKKTEESLQLFRDLMDHSNEAVFFTDPESGKFLDVNQTACNMLGYKREELLNLGPGDIQKKIPNMNPVEELRIKGNITFEGQHIRKDGSTFPVNINFRHASKGGKDYAITQVRDISGHKRTEEALRKSEERLYWSQKMEAVGTLAGGIAHDFNNVLTTIIGYTEMTLKTFNTETDAHNNLSQSLKAAHRAKDIISQLLIYSRKTEVEMKPFELDSLVSDTLKLFRSSLPATISIRNKIGMGLHKIIGNPNQIQQVLLNICFNASDAIEEYGSIRVILENVQLEHFEVAPGKTIAGYFVLLSVKDSGIGIDKKTISRIFDPFFTTKDVGKGTGLGLSAVYGIVQHHGGHITINSKLGKGTTFNVYLPATLSSAKTKTLSPKKDCITPEGSESILLVDDDETIADLGKMLLEDLGYRVKSFTCGIEALKIFREEPQRFDLVITDQTMPNITGEKLVRQLRQIRNNIPIILCTGFSDMITRKQALSFGINEYIEKPFGIDDLSWAVRRVLDSPARSKDKALRETDIASPETLSPTRLVEDDIVKSVTPAKRGSGRFEFRGTKVENIANIQGENLLSKSEKNQLLDFYANSKQEQKKGIINCSSQVYEDLIDDGFGHFLEINIYESSL